ncbi:exodeoxyribonuclease V alpha subunit [Desulforamulus putei DSM 12395]|uniref:ATP-dependent RecD2 DNA helicase n=1 Tax=Desulforamulus putei DSM 12395 TaxID=1121429 RepID=A0A1M4ZBD0_9FIRM|nr:ATP-dependent RecD-like DNA helicase [Desulforamulus putei]SHF15117.1 exodeoxyribonuclease V alpha subunit [Desulforamulus putei DSM 12395]
MCPDESPDKITYHGLVERVIFSSDEFTIFKFLPKADKKNNSFVALGNLAVKENDKLVISGEWVNHAKYGKQLKITSWEKMIPSDRATAIEYLSSGLIKGVGKRIATKIVDQLGPNAVNIILENPNCLMEVKGLGKKAEAIARSVLENYELQKIVKYLRDYGLTNKIAIRAYKTFGRMVVEYVKRNPYCLTQVQGIGFDRADAIAENLGIAKNSPDRIKGCILFVLEEALWNNGHCYLTKEQLIDRCLELLNKKDLIYVEAGDLEAPLKELEQLHIEEDRVSLDWVRQKEIQIFKEIERLLIQFPKIPVLGRTLLYESAERQKTHNPTFTLSDEQREAVAMVMRNGLSVLTGGPGTGKTQTVKAIVSIYRQIYPKEAIALAAPTGRAARRMAEVTGMEAQTLHRLLGIGKEGKPTLEEPLPYGLIIVDESSMIDILMAHWLLKNVRTGTRLLFVGDADQLPSVGPGRFLADILKSDVPKVMLKKVFRQAAESMIITNAHRVNKGQMVSINHYRDDFVLVDRENPEDVQKAILTFLEKYPDAQVLTPMKKGIIGTHELNRLAQERLNPTGKELVYGSTKYKVGDRVIQTQNDYEREVMNGDMGIITSIEDGEVTVEFYDKKASYSNGDLANLELAYAISIHKSQGSEFPTVIIPVHTTHWIMLARNLIYTAITRAKKKVILVGNYKALGIAIKNNKPIERNTLLKKLLGDTNLYN